MFLEKGEVGGIFGVEGLKYLNKSCNLNDDGKEDLIDKNELYTFDSYCDGKYKINFENWGKQDCGTFADVEWIVTYYKPKISNNIIWEFC